MWGRPKKLEMLLRKCTWWKEAMHVQLDSFVVCTIIYSVNIGLWLIEGVKL